MSEEGVLGLAEVELPLEGELPAPEELAGGVEELVAGGVVAEGEEDFEADLFASWPQAARAKTVAAAISRVLFIGLSFWTLRGRAS
jgi:hypothetical protein